MEGAAECLASIISQCHPSSDSLLVMTLRKFSFPALTLYALAAASTLSAADADSIARGKYLVEEIGKCSECHTPRTADGKSDMTKYLKGGPLSVQPVDTIPGWHKTTPDITSTGAIWARWGDAGSVKFFETGLNPRGGAADPPMPAYKMTHADAQAVVDFLKSLK
jgi:mono/diheme cytochrome c family protein